MNSTSAVAVSIHAVLALSSVGASAARVDAGSVSSAREAQYLVARVVICGNLQNYSAFLFQSVPDLAVAPARIRRLISSRRRAIAHGRIGGIIQNHDYF